MELRSTTSTAIFDNGNLHVRENCTKHKGVRNNANIRTETEDFNFVKFEVLEIILPASPAKSILINSKELLLTICILFIKNFKQFRMDFPAFSKLDTVSRKTCKLVFIGIFVNNSFCRRPVAFNLNLVEMRIMGSNSYAIMITNTCLKIRKSLNRVFITQNAINKVLLPVN